MERKTLLEEAGHIFRSSERTGGLMDSIEEDGRVSGNDHILPAKLVEFERWFNIRVDIFEPDGTPSFAVPIYPDGTEGAGWCGEDLERFWREFNRHTTK